MQDIATIVIVVRRGVIEQLIVDGGVNIGVLDLDTQDDESPPIVHTAPYHIKGDGISKQIRNKFNRFRKQSSFNFRSKEKES